MKDVFWDAFMDGFTGAGLFGIGLFHARSIE